MHRHPHFADKPSPFWAYAKLLSEQLGYSRGNAVLSYTEAEATAKFRQLGIRVNAPLLKDVLNYLSYRADILNNRVRHLLMDLPTARRQFQDALHDYQRNRFTSDLPYNKQKNEKKDYAYFTGIINILTEKTLRGYAEANHLVYGRDLAYDYNPLSLSYILNSDHELEGIMSRRFDGAFPSVVNPTLIWEIKEYYYTTTFGSRIADGVYETQLDGHEVKMIRNETKHRIYHIYFIDAYDTWWNMGKSYLCRIIDMLHTGLVDEVMFGREVFERWPELLLALVERQRKAKRA